jgi:hypothetical protein
MIGPRMPHISFDHWIIWQGSSPSEHGSRAELCFKVRSGLDTVICRSPLEAILNALHAHAIRNDALDLDDYAGYDAQKRLCERLFDRYKQAFRELAREKILMGQFALPFGEVKSVLLSEGDLSRKVLEIPRLH